MTRKIVNEKKKLLRSKRLAYLYKEDIEEYIPDILKNGEKKNKKIKKTKTQKIKPKKVEKISEEKSTNKILDLGLICDCTGSMSGWMNRAKETLNKIITNIKNSHKNLKVRVSFVGYRDFSDSKQFEIKDFTEDINSVRDFIEELFADGGGDAAEDVSGGLKKMLDLNWIGDTKIVFLICDAPEHGNKYHTYGYSDYYADKNKNGLLLENLMKDFNQKNIYFNCIKLKNDTDIMFNVMKKNYDNKNMELEVYDFNNKNIGGKSFEEVSKKFIDVVSFIISDKLKNKKKEQRKWNGEMIIGDWFSTTNYFRVDNIDGEKINITNFHGNSWDVSMDILQKMYSANHYEVIKSITRTEMVEKLKNAHDKIFTVSFLKKIKKEEIIQKLKNIKPAEIKNKHELRKLSKQLLKGEPHTLIGRLSSKKAEFGRSMVIDLRIRKGYPVRLIDHRTIDTLIINGIKYVIKNNKNKKYEWKEKDLTPKRLWNPEVLGLGDFFSFTNYITIIGFKDNLVEVKDFSEKKYFISKDIIENEMYRADHFDKKENITQTELVEHLKDAGDKIFKVTFNKLRTEEETSILLMEMEKEDFDDKKKISKFAKGIMEGEKVAIIGHLINTETKMGRSLIIDLNSENKNKFKLVDHRNIKSLIIGNVNYQKK